MNSTRTTYLPRVMPDNANLPSEFVAAAYFFPVNVLAAVMLTPGNGVLPLRTEPVISYVGAAAGAALFSVTVGESGAGALAASLLPQGIAPQRSMSSARAVALQS